MPTRTMDASTASNPEESFAAFLHCDSLWASLFWVLRADAWRALQDSTPPSRHCSGFACTAMQATEAWDAAC